ncbi:MAG: hypothetical protein A2Z95_05520 [Gallionellales bacterium GWA2_60_18]|nr:MAG: hypothetical protein A2Z95_05520 [Gallionellales bacterium GWA2_60_18]
MMEESTVARDSGAFASTTNGACALNEAKGGGIAIVLAGERPPDRLNFKQAVMSQKDSGL